MRPTRFTRALLVAAGFLVLAALLLDDPALLLGSILLLVVPCAAAMIFCKRLKRVLSAVKLVRRVSRDLVPQGSVLEVEVSVQCGVPLGSSIVFWEILPVDTAPENEFPKIPFTFSGNQSITYRIIPRVHGLIRMPGTRLELSDRFFSTSADLTAPAYAGPDIQVQPVPYFEQRKTLADPGKQETNRVRVFKGMEIRMFRDYHEGDDIKSVDWKLSAKHGKLIVREYTGIEKQPGLIIVDLPLHSLPRDTPEFIRMVKHATGEVSREIETQGTASVVLISGVNIVAGLVSERNRLHCMTFIREHAHPCERLYSAYRLRMRNDLRSLNVSIGREKKQQDPGTMQQYLDHLENVVSSGIPKYKNPEFYARCSLLVRNGPSGGIRIYSMLKGDLSHIRIILSIARQIGIDVKIFSPGLSDAAVRSRLTRSLGVTGIEAIS